MYPSVAAKFVDFTIGPEGFVPCMYLDQAEDSAGKPRPLVTYGFGQLGDPVGSLQGLPWVRVSDNSPASSADILLEWARVKTQTALAPKGGGAFIRNARLTISREACTEKVQKTLAAWEPTLTKYFTTYSALPADGQLLILSMAWGMGPNFPELYPKFANAVLASNWGVAGVECVINRPDPATHIGIRRRNAANLTLARNAAAVLCRGLPLDTLIWPIDLDPAPRP